MLAFAVGVLLNNLTIPSPPPAPREFRGVWVATVDHIDWPPKGTTDPEKQKQSLLAIFDRAQRLHLNAVLLQVRPQADALYASRLEPWSEWLTGTQGKPPQPYWDPLEFAVWEAHLRGLELHAWFNPYRVWHPADKSMPAKNYLGATHPEWVRYYGKFLWLDPGAKGVEEWSRNVILDVVRRYDIDGVHLDDYFYPYTVRDAQRKDVPFPDDKSYAQYQRDGGSLGKLDWRRHNVDSFVSTLYRDIKDVKPWVKFGISPFGIYRPNVPSGIKAGIDQYKELASDPVKWLRNGWVDYLSPQLYWPIRQTAQSYPVLAKWWSEQNPLHRHLWFGDFASGVSAAWPPKEILDEIHVTRQIPGADGTLLYSMTPLMKDSKGIDQQLESGPFSAPALVPSSPWLKKTAPRAPLVTVKRTGEGALLTLRRESTDAYQWALYLYQNGTWRFDRVTSAAQTGILVATLGGKVNAVALSALDRYGNESPRVVQKL